MGAQSNGGEVEARLLAMGLALPAPLRTPSGARLPFAFVRVHGDRAFVSGHGPTDAQGAIVGPFGRLGAELSVDQGYAAARAVGLAMLASLKAELGSLDRVQAWLKVLGMVRSAPGFDRQPAVINGFSDLILELWGKERGTHARSAVGMAELPWGIPVEIEAEVALA